MSNLSHIQHPTRFPALRFARFGRQHWQHIDASNGGQVGPIYPTRAALEADTTDYARRAGWED